MYVDFHAWISMSTSGQVDSGLCSDTSQPQKQ